MFEIYRVKKIFIGCAATKSQYQISTNHAKYAVTHAKQRYSLADEKWQQNAQQSLKYLIAKSNT